MYAEDCCHFVVTKTVLSVSGVDVPVKVGCFSKLRDAELVAESINVQTGDCHSVSITFVNIIRLSEKHRAKSDGVSNKHTPALSELREC